MNPQFGRFLGVDFSGARDAGNTIWVAEGAEADGRLIVHGLCRARDLPGGGADRSRALSALRSHLAVQDNALVGLDFPFSLPQQLIDAPDWPTFARTFTSRYSDAQAFRADCRGRTDGRELKRRTDRRTKTPFSAYNLRLYRQTYWGVAAVLAPLAEDRRMAIAPVLERPDASCTLAECCPASSLKRLDCYRPYKGRGDGLRASRAAILGRLQDEGVSCDGALEDMAISDIGGDALDAVVAAATMWRVAGRTGADLNRRDDIDALEARVFAWPDHDRTPADSAESD